VKETSYKRLHFVLFYLYEISRINTELKHSAEMVIVKGWGRDEQKLLNEKRVFVFLKTRKFLETREGGS
jgi:hypothetical protein